MANLAAVWALPIISTFVLFLRCWCRYRKGKLLSAPDVTILLAQVFNYAMSVALTFIIHYDRVVPPQPLGTTKCLYIGALVYSITLWAIKFSIVLFYRELTRNTSPGKWIIRGLVILAITGIMSTLALALTCTHPSYLWTSFETAQKCPRNWRIGASYVSAFLNVLTDIMILALPYPMLKSLPRRTKIALLVLFSTTAVIIAISCVRLVKIHYLFERASLKGDAILTLLLSALETNIGIMVASAPFIYTMFRNKGRKPSTTSTIDSGRNEKRSSIGIRNPHNVQANPNPVVC